MTLRKETANAFRLHQAGELTQAARLYQTILSRDPEHVDALHLLGILRQQQGQFAQAVELFGKAVALRPGEASFHSNLAEAYRALGQFEQAVGCCRAALTLRRDYPEAHNNLGLALHALGQFTQAAEHFQAAVVLSPNRAEAHSNLGTALRSLGEVEPAIEHFRKAIELNPKLNTARFHLGQSLLELGRAEEALPHCWLAVALQPNLAERHNKLGETFRALGRFREAIASYVEALRLKPDLAQAHANIGIALRQDGRTHESPPWLRRATELDPDTLAFWGYLADALTDLDRYPEAIECFKKMIEIEPDRAHFHNNLGWVLQQEGRSDEARQRYLTALRLQPDFLDALIGMGTLMEELGDMDEAEAWFRRAIESHPASTVALARLARLLGNQLTDDDLGLLERRIADPSVVESARAAMLFALSNVLDARRQYAEAAQCMRRANAAALAENPMRPRPYKPADHERLITSMIAAFQPEFFARFAGAGLDSRRPVFIFGMPRSGTTLIEQILASHSQLHGAGELNQGRLSFESIPVLLNRTDSPPDCIPYLSAEVVRQVASRHESRLLELGRGAPRVADKMTDNYIYLGLLAILFPNATFIHSRRDLHDIAVSSWMTNFRGIPWTNDPQHFAHRVQQYLRLMDRWRTVLPAPIHEVDYEETVDDLNGVARRLVAACGLDWEPACLEFHRTKRSVRTSSLAQVRQPIYKASVGRWKNYEHELGDLFSALADISSVGTRRGGEPTPGPVDRQSRPAT
jgi:tetratricopeptide (TPR) repeat protein